MKREVDLDRASKAMRDFLSAIGVDVSLLGLEDTPLKVATMYSDLFSGLNESEDDIWGELYETNATGPVSIRDLPFYSLCEHHLLPFFGTVNIIYIPRNGIVAGFGKFAKVINLYSRRPQLQERLNEDIANAIYQGLVAEGVLVGIKATQLCMRMTNVNNEGAYTSTIVAKGVFANNDSYDYQELFNISGGKN